MSDLISRSKLIDYFYYGIDDKPIIDGISDRKIIDIIKNQPSAYSVDKVVEEQGYNAGYKEAFEETLATIKYYADMWDGIYQAIDELEKKWKEWEDKNTYE